MQRYNLDILNQLLAEDLQQQNNQGDSFITNILLLMESFQEYLEYYLEGYTSDLALTNDEIFKICFGLNGIKEKGNFNFSHLDHADKISFIEGMRGFLYINQIASELYAGNGKIRHYETIDLKFSSARRAQISLLSLRSHIERAQCGKKLKLLFNTFLKKILSCYSEEISEDELRIFNSLDFIMIFGSNLYDLFIYYRSRHTIHEYKQIKITNRNYTFKLHSLLGQSSLTKIEKHIVIETAWNVLSDNDKSSQHEFFFKLLGEYATTGCAASSYWILSRLKRSVSCDTEQPWQYFSPDDQMSFVINALSFPILHMPLQPTRYFSLLLASDMKKQMTREKIAFYINFLKLKSPSSIELISLQLIFLNMLDKYKNFIQLSDEGIQECKNRMLLEEATALRIILAAESHHPIIMKGLETTNLQTLKFWKAAEIRKNARMVGQGSRCFHSRFFGFPRELLSKISGFTRNPEFHSEDEAEKIAVKYLGKTPF